MVSEGWLTQCQEEYMVPEALLTGTWSWELLERVVNLDYRAEPELIRCFLATCFPSEVDASEDEARRSWCCRLLEHLAATGTVERNVCVDVAVATERPVDIAWRRVRLWINDELNAEGESLFTSPLQLKAIGLEPAPDAPPGSGRRAVRARLPCAVCARFGWDREEVYMWTQAKGSGHGSFIEDDLRRFNAASRSGADGPDGLREGSRGASAAHPRDLIGEMLSPANYWSRWGFRRKNQERGGIPIEELEASAVRDPDTGKLWLLHWCGTKACSSGLEIASRRFLYAPTASAPWGCGGRSCPSTPWRTSCGSGSCPRRSRL